MHVGMCVTLSNSKMLEKHNTFILDQVRLQSSWESLLWVLYEGQIIASSKFHIHFSNVSGASHVPVIVYSCVTVWKLLSFDTFREISLQIGCEEQKNNNPLQFKQTLLITFLVIFTLLFCSFVGTQTSSFSLSQVGLLTTIPIISEFKLTWSWSSMWDLGRLLAHYI